MLCSENSTQFDHVTPQTEALAELQVRAAKKRLVKLTLNKAFRHSLPESTWYFIHSIEGADIAPLFVSL